VTGDEAKAIRNSLGLEAQEMAEFLGVHMTSVYRWERCGTAKLKMFPASERLYLAARNLVSANGSGWAEQLREALLVNGWRAAWALIVQP
jgi:transcriptional regulator with XRE-family HTH domain